MAKEEATRLYNEFQSKFPLEKLKNLKLEEYTNLNREDSFCYWLETKTESLGSIWGGSAYKFGIFKVLKTGGDLNLGGNDIDNEIIELLENKYNIKLQQNLFFKNKLAIEILKSKISFNNFYLSLNLSYSLNKISY